MYFGENRPEQQKWLFDLTLNEWDTDRVESERVKVKSSPKGAKDFKMNTENAPGEWLFGEEDEEEHDTYRGEWLEQQEGLDVDESAEARSDAHALWYAEY